MLNRLLNTRVPTIIFMLAFVGSCLMFCITLAAAREPAEITSSVMHALVLWGTLSLVLMLAFCLCLAKVTRYRRNLPTN